MIGRLFDRQARLVRAVRPGVRLVGRALAPICFDADEMTKFRK
jgi:hypothetical protein